MGWKPGAEAVRKHLPLVGGTGGGGERRGPPPPLLRQWRRKSARVWDFCVFFTKTARAGESTVCIGKMSLEGAKKHMWD